MKPPKSFPPVISPRNLLNSLKVQGAISCCIVFQKRGIIFIVFYAKSCKRATCTTRTGTGSLSQEQEVTDSMMTMERRMEYLRGRPVAKKRAVTLSDFDNLLHEEHSLYQLFEYQGFLHQLSWTEGFCVDAVVQDFFCALVSVDRAPEVQLESMEEQLKELRTAFDGECTVTMLRNKSVVAHMANVNEQLEDIKKTLDDFKMEADPQRIPGDIPDDVATFRDAVRR
ncbi:hypothetical protein CJ030_MR5G011908 [Morella rubra]|uniref:Uncharacterized protein n=1 Tax=Morella rubra TaxID=262757 RepID=A0A6A1VLW9_9ROSI|nr:hypothetical protein CJ030_MR5G011908 [Morella rubra]